MTQRTFPLSMWMLLKGPFGRLNFSRQFVVVSFAVRAAGTAAIYVESILAAQLRQYASGGGIGSDTHAALDRVFVEGPLRREVVRFKLWGPDGHILYSSDHGGSGPGQGG